MNLFSNKDSYASVLRWASVEIANRGSYLFDGGWIPSKKGDWRRKRLIEFKFVDTVQRFIHNKRNFSI